MDSMATADSVYLLLKSALESYIKTHSLHLRLCRHLHNLNFDARVDVDTSANVTCEGIRCVKMDSVVQ